MYIGMREGLTCAGGMEGYGFLPTSQRRLVSHPSTVWVHVSSLGSVRAGAKRVSVCVSALESVPIIRMIYGNGPYDRQ